MKTIHSTIFRFLLLLIPGVIIAQTNSASLLKKVKGFSHPESVVHDEENGTFYVSNMGGKEEGDGFISKVSRDGEVLELQWVSGLNDPKGLLVVDGKLYVTNNTEFVEMDIEGSEITKTTAVEGAVSLNDITKDEQGNLYISDSGKSSIYKMDASGEISEWLNTEELEYPNGLLVVEDELYVAAWGQEDPGNVLKVNLDNKEIEKVSTNGIGNLDGIQKIGNGEFYISDWATGKIYRIDDQGNQTEILTSEKSAGDILFMEEENGLILPMNHQNEVWYYQLD